MRDVVRAIDCTDDNQNKNVMLTTRMLAAAIIRNSEPSKPLKIRNMAPSRRPDTLTATLSYYSADEIDLDQKLIHRGFSLRNVAVRAGDAVTMVFGKMCMACAISQQVYPRRAVFTDDNSPQRQKIA